METATKRSFHQLYAKPILFMGLLLLLAGIYSYTRMQSNLFPEVLFPRITVIADAGQQPIRAKGDNRSRRLCPRAYAVSAKHFREHPGP